jgi:hypothetical protein
MSLAENSLDQLQNPAHLLLADLFELHQLEPDYQSWFKADFTAESPRFYRRQRIQALMQSLKISQNHLATLFDGEIMKQSEIQVNLLLAKFPALTLHVQSHPLDPNKMTKYEWSSFYYCLFQHALLLHAALNVNAGVLLASGLTALATAYTNDINEAIHQQSREELAILVYLLNPLEVLFSLNQLHADHAYPLVDLDEVDLNWL